MAHRAKKRREKGKTNFWFLPFLFFLDQSHQKSFFCGKERKRRKSRLDRSCQRAFIHASDIGSSVIRKWLRQREHVTILVIILSYAYEEIDSIISSINLFIPWYIHIKAILHCQWCTLNSPWSFQTTLWRTCNYNFSSSSSSSSSSCSSPSCRRIKTHTNRYTFSPTHWRSAKMTS